MPIVRTTTGPVAVLTLALGRGNAIDHAFMDAVHAALDAEERTAERAVVITAEGRTFCGGLDLVKAWDFDRAAMDRYVDAFEGMFRRVAAFPKPVVAAVNGHALAGGCILAMAADWRIMASGPSLIGVHEVLVGIPFPATAFEIARRALPGPARAEAFLEGRRFSPEEALRAGLLHALAEPGALAARAADKARLFCDGAPEAIRETKADLVAPLLARIDAAYAARKGRFLDHWFGPAARARIGALRDELLRKRAAG